MSRVAVGRTARRLCSAHLPRLQSRFSTSPTPRKDTEFRASSHANTVARAENIGFPYYRSTKLKVSHLGTASTGLSVSTWPEHIFHPWHLKYFQASGHPFIYPMLDRYVDKGKQPLWWWVMVYSHDDIPYRAWVSQKMRRRVGRAVQEALRRKGYDAAGRRISGDEAQDGTGQAHDIQELYGTFKAEGSIAKLVHLKPEDLVAFFLDVVTMLEHSLGRRETSASAPRSHNCNSKNG